MPWERVSVGRHEHDDFVAEDESGEIVAYCSFGPYSMVPPRSYDDGFANVAWGVRPDLVGMRNGRSFIGSIVHLASAQYPAQIPRASIRRSNERSKRAAMSAGFRATETLGDYVILEYQRPKRREAVQDSGTKAA
jgi:L-amino acid N-acyltransferase YncA